MRRDGLGSQRIWLRFTFGGMDHLCMNYYQICRREAAEAMKVTKSIIHLLFLLIWWYEYNGTWSVWEDLDFHLSLHSWLLRHLIHKKHKLWKESYPLNIFILIFDENVSNSLKSLVLTIHDWLRFYLSR